VEEMKGKRKGQAKEKPALETEHYRIWDARGMTKEEQEEAKRVSLGVYDGERIHGIVTFSIGAGLIVKVLSKQRISDGRLNVLIRLDKPDGRCTIMRCEEWITLEQYNNLVSAMKKEFGEGCATVIKGEDLHIGLSHAIDKIERKQPHEERGRKAPDASVGKARATSRVHWPSNIVRTAL
jgi:hypothetical protein